MDAHCGGSQWSRGVQPPCPQILRYAQDDTTGLGSQDRPCQLARRPYFVTSPNSTLSDCWVEEILSPRRGATACSPGRQPWVCGPRLTPSPSGATAPSSTPFGACAPRPRCRPYRGSEKLFGPFTQGSRPGLHAVAPSGGSVSLRQSDKLIERYCPLTLTCAGKRGRGSATCGLPSGAIEKGSGVRGSAPQRLHVPHQLAEDHRVQLSEGDDALFVPRAGLLDRHRCQLLLRLLGHRGFQGFEVGEAVAVRYDPAEVDSFAVLWGLALLRAGFAVLFLLMGLVGFLLAPHS